LLIEFIKNSQINISKVKNPKSILNYMSSSAAAVTSTGTEYRSSTLQLHARSLTYFTRVARIQFTDVFDD
jgi:hypothetical protein